MILTMSPSKQEYFEVDTKEGKKDGITEPNDYDVLCDKGKAFSNHIGNIIFRSKLDAVVDTYMNARTKYDKMGITKEVVDSMEACYNTRFLKRVFTPEGQHAWEEISEQMARDKVSHALRFAAKNRLNEAVGGKKNSKARDCFKAQQSMKTSSAWFSPKNENKSALMAPIVASSRLEHRTNQIRHDSATSVNAPEPTMVQYNTSTVVSNKSSLIGMTITVGTNQIIRRSSLGFVTSEETVRPDKALSSSLASVRQLFLGQRQLSESVRPNDQANQFSSSNERHAMLQEPLEDWHVEEI